MEDKLTNDKYARAYKEVLEVIKYFPKEELDKIPQEEIEFFEGNMDKDYEFSINPEVELSEQNLSKEARSIIVVLFQKHFATEEQKKEIDEIIRLNEIKAEQEKKKKYDPKKLFEKDEKSDITQKDNKEAELIVKERDGFFVKFKEFIFKLLKISDN